MENKKTLKQIFAYKIIDGNYHPCKNIFDDEIIDIEQYIDNGYKCKVQFNSVSSAENTKGIYTIILEKRE